MWETAGKEDMGYNRKERIPEVGGLVVNCCVNLTGL
jgi:hypothetical protein